MKDFEMTVDIHFYTIKGTGDALYLLPTYLDGIHNAVSFMKQVIHEKKLFFTAYTTASGKQMTTISSLGRHFKHLHNYSQLFSKDYTYSPWLGFFFKEFRKHPIKDYLPSMYGHDHVGVDLFNDFVATMRKKARAINLKKRVDDWESKPKKNMKRLVEFEAALFRRTARVMAVRLDFNYHKAAFTPSEADRVIAEAALQKERDQADYLDGQDISTPRVVEGRIALEEVQKDRKRLFTNMKGKPSLFKYLVGYVWRIECGRAAGYHLHVLFFFDGSNVEKHEHIAQEIGYYWQNMITNGRSYFENCNRKKEKYGDAWALGEIDHWDAAKRGKLNHALQYFCKTNQIVQVVPYAGCRLFGCGFVHRQRKVQGGRPRTKGVVGPDHHRL
jgi:hypothetical protein